MRLIELYRTYILDGCERPDSIVISICIVCVLGIIYWMALMCIRSSSTRIKNNFNRNMDNLCVRIENWDRRMQDLCSDRIDDGEFPDEIADWADEEMWERSRLHR